MGNQQETRGCLQALNPPQAMKQKSIRRHAHRKVKGSFGELKVATDLVRQGYAVFSELGDNSKVDLIVLVDHVPVKLQVKCYASSNGVVSVYGRKTGPNYRYHYRREHPDVFAVYVYDRDVVLYVSAGEIVGHGRERAAQRYTLVP